MSGENTDQEKDELLLRLENERQEEYNKGNSSSSLQSIVNSDFKETLRPTTLFPIILTVIGFAYVAMTQVINFNNSIESLETGTKKNSEQIQTISSESKKRIDDLENLVYNSTNSLDVRVKQIESALDKLRDSHGNEVRYLNDGISRRFDQIKDSIEDLNDKLDDISRRMNENSSKVSNLETELRILKIKYSNTNSYKD